MHYCIREAPTHTLSVLDMTSGAEEPSAGAKASCRRTQRPEICHKAVIAPPGQHLGGHIVWGAAGGAQQPIIPLAVRQRPQAEVRQLGVGRLAGIQQHILQLDVSVATANAAELVSAAA